MIAKVGRLNRRFQQASKQMAVETAVPGHQMLIMIYNLLWEKRTRGSGAVIAIGNLSWKHQWPPNADNGKSKHVAVVGLSQEITNPDSSSAGLQSNALEQICLNGIILLL